MHVTSLRDGDAIADVARVVADDDDAPDVSEAPPAEAPAPADA